MTRLVLKLSPLAKVGAVVVVIGVAFALYGKMREVAWADRLGFWVVLAGAAVYFFARIRMSGRK